MVSPRLSSKAEVSVERGKVKKVRGGFCVSPGSGRVSVVQSGMSICIFAVPAGASRLRISLKRDTPGYTPEGYCLRR